MSVNKIIPDDYGKFTSGASKVKEKVPINNGNFYLGRCYKSSL